MVIIWLSMNLWLLFEDINPATGEVPATIQQTSNEQIDEAVKAAQKVKVWADIG
jgi:acyl-CoA reductase-like NAD-dependent aldehyde dehydrogenase